MARASDTLLLSRNIARVWGHVRPASLMSISARFSPREIGGRGLRPSPDRGRPKPRPATPEPRPAPPRPPPAPAHPRAAPPPRPCPAGPPPRATSALAAAAHGASETLIGSSVSAEAIAAVAFRAATRMTCEVAGDGLGQTSSVAATAAAAAAFLIGRHLGRSCTMERNCWHNYSGSA